jgi:hypothetical protein
MKQPYRRIAALFGLGVLALFVIEAQQITLGVLAIVGTWKISMALADWGTRKNPIEQWTNHEQKKLSPEAQARLKDLIDRLEKGGYK